MDEKFINKLQYGNLGEVLECLKKGKLEKVRYSLYKKGDWSPSVKYVITKGEIAQYNTDRNFHATRQILCEGEVTHDHLWRLVWSRIISSKSEYECMEVTICKNRNEITRSLKI